MRLKLYTTEELWQKYGDRFTIWKDTLGEYYNVVSENENKPLYLSREEYDRLAANWLPAKGMRGMQYIVGNYIVRTRSLGHRYIWKEYVKETVGSNDEPLII